MPEDETRQPQALPRPSAKPGGRMDMAAQEVGSVARIHHLRIMAKEERPLFDFLAEILNAEIPKEAFLNPIVIPRHEANAKIAMAGAPIEEVVQDIRRKPLGRVDQVPQYQKAFCPQARDQRGESLEIVQRWIRDWNPTVTVSRRLADMQIGDEQCLAGAPENRSFRSEFEGFSGDLQQDRPGHDDLPVSVFGKSGI